ncbi:MAG: AsnC family transcriptional regulator [Nanoarchaeota archaeon]|jgi:Lrp/AsnC family transcriptional regulator for asnA, asnC and gidA|nr:AsnC family transcriptional regulator [Nanoarchaeota archaeon]
MVRRSYIDDIDNKIIKILINNSRISNTKIAKLLNISEASVRKRIKKIMKHGIIKKFTVELNYNLLGYKRVFIGLNIDKDKIFNILEKISKNKNIINIYLAGGDHDILVDFLYSKPEELDEYIKYLQSIEGIKSIWPTIIIDYYWSR